MERTPCHLGYDMRKLLDNIDKWLRKNKCDNYESPSDQYNFIQRSIGVVNNCMSGNCRFINKEGECIVKQLNENGVDTL